MTEKKHSSRLSEVKALLAEKPDIMILKSRVFVVYKW